MSVVPYSSGIEAEIGMLLREASAAIARPSELLTHLMAPDANHARCQLFRLHHHDCVVQYDDVFSGRILYEASFFGDLLKRLTSGTDVKLSSLYQVSLQRENVIVQKFKPRATRGSQSSPRKSIEHCRHLVAAASLTVDVLLTRHEYLYHFNSTGITYDQQFIRSLVGISGKHGRTDDMLPPFSELLSRFHVAATLLFNEYTSYSRDGSAFILKLTEAHGLAWKGNVEQSSPNVTCIGAKDPITASQAAGLISPIAEDVIKRAIGDVSNPRNYLDVVLGITKLEEVVEADDDELSEVTTIKKDIELGSHGNTFLLGIYGHFISPVFQRKLIRHVQEDLEFCTSPTGNRMLRVSSNVKESLFLLGNKVRYHDCVYSDHSCP